MVPQATSPLTKSVRTIEGILVVVFNVAMLIVPIVSNALSAKEAATFAVIASGTLVVCRTGLKVIALLSGITGAPTIPSGIPDTLGGLPADSVLGAIDAAESAATVAQSQPGTAPASVVSGLAPDAPKTSKKKS